MNDMLLTTRNTSKGKFISDMIGVGIGFIVLFCLALYNFSMADKAEDLWKFSAAEDLRSAGVALMFVAFVGSILEFAYYFLHFQTYADVYQDRIVGKGIEKFVVQASFDLRFDQIMDVSQNKGFLNAGAGKNAFLVINTTGGSYKISTTAQRADEIMAFFQQHRR